MVPKIIFAGSPSNKTELAQKRFENYAKQPLKFEFPAFFNGTLPKINNRKVKAAIIREKGVNGDREMAYSMYMAGMNVRDIHMTDLIEGRENLQDVNMIVFVGGFSNSDVLGSAKGWAAGFLFNPKAKKALDDFYARPDTLSLGVCNGCQLMVELGIFNDKTNKIPNPEMHWNESGKFESSLLAYRFSQMKMLCLKLSKTQNLVFGLHMAKAALF